MEWIKPRRPPVRPTPPDDEQPRPQPAPIQVQVGVGISYQPSPANPTQGNTAPVDDQTSNTGDEQKDPDETTPLLAGNTGRSYSAGNPAPSHITPPSNQAKQPAVPTPQQPTPANPLSNNDPSPQADQPQEAEEQGYGEEKGEETQAEQPDGEPQDVQTLDISPQGLKFIAKHEGFRTEVYNDIFGNPTIGYGHKLLPGEAYTTITREQALELLRKDALIAIRGVQRHVKVPLTQHQFDALVSFVYNNGVGNQAKKKGFAGSTLLKKLNEGKFDEVPYEMNRWTSGGVRGLVNRRNYEIDLFMNGIY